MSKCQCVNITFMGNSVYHKKDETEFFPTDNWIRDEIYNEINSTFLNKERISILDPCCGDGGLEVFNDKYDYTLYDIEDRGINANICDFLKKPYNNEQYDCVVINPPFGLTVEFVRQAKKYSNIIFVIAPIKTICKNFGTFITWGYFNPAIPYKGFGILTSVGVFKLDFNQKKLFGYAPPSVKKFIGEQLPESETFAAHFYETDKAPNKYFIVDRLTKARVLRYEPLIYDTDLYEPNDESAFIAIAGNTNVKAGDKIKRFICEFDSKEDMIAFKNSYNAQQGWLRNYMYRHGNTILRQNEKPWINDYYEYSKQLPENFEYLEAQHQHY